MHEEELAEIKAKTLTALTEIELQYQKDVAPARKDYFAAFDRVRSGQAFLLAAAS